MQEMMLLAQQCEKCLADIYKPEGFNIGINVGKCAGAGVESHLHLHVIPRWIGDSNFVATAGQTRIVPELLESTYQKVIQGLKNT
jgi:ATP adenylyltransferase